MNKYIVSFGGKEKGINRHNLSFGIHKDYTAEVQRLFKSAEQFGYIPLYYDDVWLLTSEYAKNESCAKILLEDSYGWVMKPVVIKDALSKIDYGDYLFWNDSNHILINPQPICDMCINNPYGIYAHDHPGVEYYNKDWTTKDMFVGMGCDEIRYWDSIHLQVNVTAYIKNEFTIKFANEWAKYATNYDIMIKNDLPNYPGFKEKRHEQSIFSILIEKYKIPHYPYPGGYIHEEDGINV